MKINRKFGVIWEDLIDKNKEPLQAVRVVLYMPKEIADIERSVIEEIKNLIEEFAKNA